MTSLRRKITVSYSLLAGLIILLSIFAFADMLFLESQIDEGRVINLLKDDVLDMRRHEKNLLLYHNLAELDQIQKLSLQASENLSRYRMLYLNMLGEDQFNALMEDIHRYRVLFEAYEQVNNPAQTSQSVLDSIRQLGHRVSEAINQMALDERRQLVAKVNKSQWILAGAILVMGIIVVAIGWRMSRVVSAPLKMMEKKMGFIANGRFDYMKPVTQDREFITFTHAFNRMLHELDVRHRRLLQAEKLASLGVLVSGVAHELNNPLGNISSSCQLLLEELNEPKPEQQREWLQQIDDETVRAQHIVKALLEYGQKQSFNLQRLLLKDVVDKSLLLLRNQLKHAAAVSIDISEEFSIRADFQRMQQVFINIIRNALHAGGAGVQINIRAISGGSQSDSEQNNIHFVGDPACVLNQEREYCEIEIADNGPGISGDIIDNIFDPFFTTDEPGHGSGLGLYIVQEIILEHDGCIGVVSNVGEGCRFIIRLPCGDVTA